MDGTDPVALAGTIGTWVAVLLALIALIAVIGPVLIWAAARTERNQALHDAGDTRQPFISSGIHFMGSNVRLFRRVRAPILNESPEISSLTWDLGRFTESKSRATWIQFANLLLGYQATLRTADNLVIYRAKAILPVHRTWILAVGLAGRYSATRSKSIARRRLTGTVRFDPSAEGSAAEVEAERGPWSVETTLNGTTGQIKISGKVSGVALEDSPVVIFLPRPMSELAGIEAEKLSILDLLMLAVGCLPLPSSQYIVLVELWYNDEAKPDYISMDYEGLTPPDLRGRAARRRAITDPYNSSSLESLPASTQSRKSFSRSNPGPDEVQLPLALRLDRVADRDEEMERLTRPSGGMKELWAFEPQTLDARLLTDLRAYMGTTFVDPSVEWIRVPTVDNPSTQPSNIFMWRADAQKAALGLLSLSWHPQGYLISGSSSAHCIRMLEFAGRQFLYLLTRVRENIELLTLSQHERLSLRDSLNAADKKARKEQVGVPISPHGEFCELDRLLSASGHTEPKVNDMIGILMMTNEEFASFAQQSARHFDKSITGTLEIVMRTGLVKVKLPFGGVQDFPVDMNNLYRDWQGTDDIITVNYTAIMLACLRASLRSFLLNIRVDGSSLMREILKMNDVVYVA